MAHQAKKLSFKVTRNEIPVEIEDAAGTVKDYTLREFDGHSRDAYMNQIRDKAHINAEGNVTGFKTFEGIQSGLLALCLYDDKRQLVDEKIIQSFPTMMLSELFKAAQVLNGLVVSEASKEEVKND